MPLIIIQGGWGDKPGVDFNDSQAVRGRAKDHRQARGKTLSTVLHIVIFYKCTKELTLKGTRH